MIATKLGVVAEIFLLGITENFDMMGLFKKSLNFGFK